MRGSSNTTGNRRQGKLETAIGHSHIKSPWNPGIEVDIEVRETYVYGGKDGRVSRRDTQVEDFVLAEGLMWNELCQRSCNATVIGTARWRHRRNFFQVSRQQKSRRRVLLRRQIS